MIRDIEKILHDGVTAPSGENCQPWKFRVQGDTLSIFNVPEADTSLYNSQQKGSYVANGALLENIIMSAGVHGYATTHTLFPDTENENHVADVVFQNSQEKEKDALYDYLHKRCTNRKDYTGEKLSTHEKEIMLTSGEELNFNTLHIIDDEEKLMRIGELLAVNEKVLFENKLIHDFFYEHIIWDKKDEEKSGGFYIDTLEFLPHQLPLVKIFKNWNVLYFLNKVFSISKMISKENGEKYAKSGSIGAIIMKGSSMEDYVNLGRSMQRVWLTATKLGIAVHPCNGTLYFMERIQDSGGKEFSKKHNTLIIESYKEMIEIFNTQDKKIGFIFRMGRAQTPTAVAKRKSPIVQYA